MKIKRSFALDPISFISLTDIMMTVLLFFILTSGASQEKYEPFINIKHKTPLEDRIVKFLEIVIDKDGNFFIDKKKIVKSQLKNIIKKSGCQNVLMTVDKLVPIGYIAEIMNIASDLDLSTTLRAAEK